MALGCCPTCQKLVSVNPGDRMPGRDKQREYTPIAHTRRTHGACPLHVEIETACDCGKSTPDDVFTTERCPNETPIR